MGENAKTDTTDKNQITDKTDSPKETEWQEVHILEDLICMKTPADWVKPPEEWIKEIFFQETSTGNLYDSHGGMYPDL